MFFLVGWSSAKHRDLGTVDKLCPFCGRPSSHLRAHDYRVGYIMFLPFAAMGHAYTEKCASCGRITELPAAPPGTPSIPFMQRFGAVFLIIGFFAAIPLLLLIPAFFNKRDREAYKEKQAAEQANADEAKARAREEAAANAAFKDVLATREQIEAEDVACNNDALKLMPAEKTRFSLPAKKPKAASVLRGSAFLLTNAALYDHDAANVLLTNTKFACSTAIPEKLKKLKTFSDVGPFGSLGPLSDRKAEAEATLALAKEHRLPSVVGLLDGECSAKTHKCQIVALWVGNPKRDLIALARVTGPLGPEGEKGAFKKLAPEITRAVNAWK